MGNPLDFFDKSSCNALWQLNVIHLNNFSSRYQKNCSLSRCVNYSSLLYFSIPLTGRALVSSIALLIITGSIWATSLHRNLPGDVGLQLVQDGRARAEDLGLREATVAEVKGEKVRGRGDHSLPLKHLLLITVAPNWMSRYLMSAPAKGRIYRLSRKCVTHVRDHIQKDSTQPPF